MLNFNASKCWEMAGDSEIAKTSKIIFGDSRMTLPAGVTFVSGINDEEGLL